MKFKTIIVLFIDCLTRSITSWLAYESQLKELQSLIPPKAFNDSKRLRLISKSLPKQHRGAFLYLVHNLVKQEVNARTAIRFALEDIKDVIKRENKEKREGK